MKVHVLLEQEHPEDNWSTVEYVVSMRLDKAPDTGWCWWMEGVTPQPPTEAIEEKVMEGAVKQLEDATESALDAAEYGVCLVRFGSWR